VYVFFKKKGRFHILISSSSSFVMLHCKLDSITKPRKCVFRLGIKELI